MLVANRTLSVFVCLLICDLLPYVSYAELNNLRHPFAQSYFYDYGGAYMNEARGRSNMSRSGGDNRHGVAMYDMSNINNYKRNEGFERRRRYNQEYANALSTTKEQRLIDRTTDVEDMSEAVIEDEHVHGGESNADEPLVASADKMRQQRATLDLEVDTHMKTEFLGSNLFDAIHRTCFTQDEVVLLQTRRDFELMIPKFFAANLLSDHKVCLIMKYFNRVGQIVAGISEPETHFDAMRSFYDTLGGYLRHSILPMARLSFYAGRLRLCTVERLTQMYQECRDSLNTRGNGWRSPPRDLLDRLSHGEVLPLTTTYKTTEPSACTLLDLHSINRDASNMQMLVALPHLDDDGENDFLMNIALPFKRRRIYNLRSPNSAFILVRFFLIVSRCYETTGMCQDTYNNRFKEWINKNLQAHMIDETFYPGLGGILRVYENLRRTKKSIGNSSLTSRFMKLASGGLGVKDFVVDDVGEPFEEEIAEAENDEAELENWEESKTLTAADDDDDAADDNESESDNDDDDDDEAESEVDEHEHAHAKVYKRKTERQRKRKREHKRVKGMESTEQPNCDAQQGSANKDQEQTGNPQHEPKESNAEEASKNVSNYVRYMCVMLAVLLALLFIITLCNVYRKSLATAPRASRGKSNDSDPSCSCASAASSDASSPRSQRCPSSVRTPPPASQSSTARTTPRQRVRERHRSQTDSQDCCQKCFSSGPKKKTSSAKSTRRKQNCDEIIELQPNSRSVQPNSRAEQPNSKSGGSNTKSMMKSSSSKRTPSKGASTALSNSDKQHTRRVHYLQQNLYPSDEMYAPDIDVERQLDIDGLGSSDSIYEQSRPHYPTPRELSVYSRLINEGKLSEEAETLSEQCAHTDDSDDSSNAHELCTYVGFDLNLSRDSLSPYGSERSNEAIRDYRYELPMYRELDDDYQNMTA